jgi:hypothetical protein
MKTLVILLAALSSIIAPVQATILSTATASFGGTIVCSQSGSASALCNPTSGFNTVDASATSNLTVTAGLLDAVVNAIHSAGGFNNSPSGTSSAAFNSSVVVTGGTGTGILVANFTGFDDASASGPPPANPVLSLSFGATNTTFTPGLTNSPFSFSTVFAYGTPLNFNAGISAAAQAPLLMMNAAANSVVEGKVTFTGFTVENANGQPVTATVALTPEPSFSMLAGLILLTAVIARARFSGSQRPEYQS